MGKETCPKCHSPSQVWVNQITGKLTCHRAGCNNLEIQVSPDVLSVTVYDGKYTVRQDASGRLTALRYGQPWRDCVGDGLILALAQEVQNLRDRKTCQWKEDENGPWATQCGQSFEFTYDGVKENGFKFCCYCGGEITVKAAEPQTVQ
jgi:hypothetical protein